MHTKHIIRKNKKNKKEKTQRTTTRIQNNTQQKNKNKYINKIKQTQ